MEEVSRIEQIRAEMTRSEQRWLEVTIGSYRTDKRRWNASFFFNKLNYFWHYFKTYTLHRGLWKYSKCDSGLERIFSSTVLLFPVPQMLVHVPRAPNRTMSPNRFLVDRSSTSVTTKRLPSLPRIISNSAGTWRVGTGSSTVSWKQFKDWELCNLDPKKIWMKTGNEIAQEEQRRFWFTCVCVCTAHGRNTEDNGMKPTALWVVVF